MMGVHTSQSSVLPGGAASGRSGHGIEGRKIRSGFHLLVCHRSPLVNASSMIGPLFFFEKKDNDTQAPGAEGLMIYDH
jgi:hypothetical protein